MTQDKSINADNNQNEIRKKKLIDMKKNGFSFPNQFKKNMSLQDIRKKYENKTIVELKKLNINFSIAGRMIQKRIMGQATFFTLQEMHSTIQLYIKDHKDHKDHKKNYKKWDIGDILSATGTLFKTKTGELSIFCSEINILTKSLKPLPDKFHGLANQEKRYRQRYLDLISNKKLFHLFKKRSDIIIKIRNFMIEKNFLEVETPMLQNMPGGAVARPFITYHNELNMNMYLRVAPELYLKQLVIGGFERIFELNRNFRNEGISARHNPEFTMMEAYMAYSNYKDMIKIIEELCQNIAMFLFKKNTVKYHKYLLDFKKPFCQLSMTDAILKFYPEIHANELKDIKKIKNIAKKMGILTYDEWTLGKIQNEIFEKNIEKKLIQPTFITHYPVEVSPLARRNDLNHNVTDRFELFIAGYEIANGFSELNDVEDQKNRFLKQITTLKNEKNKCLFYDKDYIEALKYGLPPTSGMGIGIDRLIMIFTNQTSIRDVILFPTLRSIE
ncbi:lysine--tRNA ligase [Buchnera aphidicola]|uniref:lysine--tRNA ligase n=1 Tax=Buchnera aphidicola TaxID=9 RepID=UPI0034641223